MSLLKFKILKIRDFYCFCDKYADRTPDTLIISKNRRNRGPKKIFGNKFS